MDTPKSFVKYPEERTLYLKDAYGRFQSITATGETSKSWVSGRPWNPTEFKYPKSEYSLVTKDDFDAYLWESRNRYYLAHDVQYKPLGAGVLRKIAELIGYVEPPHK